MPRNKLRLIQHSMHSCEVWCCHIDYHAPSNNIITLLTCDPSVAVLETVVLIFIDSAVEVFSLGSSLVVMDSEATSREPSVNLNAAWLLSTVNYPQPLPQTHTQVIILLS